MLAGVVLEFAVPVPSEYNGAAGYSLALHLLSPTGKIEIASGNFTADGDTFEASVPAATSAAWAPGLYTWHAIATNGTDKRAVGEGRVRVLPNVLTATSGVDLRSHNAKMVDLLQALLEGKASNDQQEATVDGVALKRMSPEDVLKLYNDYLGRLARETARASGKKSNIIRVHFTGG